MEPTFSDQEITALIEERKVLPDDWHSYLLRKRDLVVIGENGNEFRIIARQNTIRPADFSVILTVRVPSSKREFRLRRYNGWTNPHRNRIEKEEIDGFHIHFATERYQRIGLNEDTYAQTTDRYSDFSGALQCLIADTNFEKPAQQTFF